MSASSSSNACKLLLLGRCLRAVLLSVAIQFLLLTVFLLFVNFQLLHPLAWVTGTLRLVASWYTWFASIPLVASVSSTLGDGAMSIIPWRRSGVTYANNEIYFDIVEEIDCIVER